VWFKRNTGAKIVFFSSGLFSDLPIFYKIYNNTSGPSIIISQNPPFISQKIIQPELWLEEKLKKSTSCVLITIILSW